MNKYQVTFRVHDGWKYNDPKHYSTRVETIEANSREEAYCRALTIADKDDKEMVTVFKKDVVLIEKGKKRTSKSFAVTLYYHTNVTVEVEARDEQEALSRAYEEASKKKYEKLILEGLQEDNSPDIEKI